MPNLLQLQAQAIQLYHVIEKKARTLEAERLKLGKLLLRIRDQFIKAQGGSKLKRGKNGGSFCVWLKDSGFNLGTAYSYMAQAEGKDNGRTPSRKRIQYWQRFAQRMKDAKTNAAKIKLLRQAVAHLTTLYDIHVEQATIR